MTCFIVSTSLIMILLPIIAPQHNNHFKHFIIVVHSIQNFGGHKRGKFPAKTIPFEFFKRRRTPRFFLLNKNEERRGRCGFAGSGRRKDDLIEIRTCRLNLAVPLHFIFFSNYKKMGFGEMWTMSSKRRHAEWRFGTRRMDACSLMVDCRLFPTQYRIVFAN